MHILYFSLDAVISERPFFTARGKCIKKMIKYLSLYLLRLVRVKGLEPPCRKALDPKSSASANFATLAKNKMVDLIGLEPMTARL